MYCSAEGFSGQTFKEVTGVLMFQLHKSVPWVKETWQSNHSYIEITGLQYIHTANPGHPANPDNSSNSSNSIIEPFYCVAIASTELCELVQHIFLSLIHI